MRKIIYIVVSLLLVLTGCGFWSGDKNNVKLSDLVDLSRDIEPNTELYEQGTPLTINYWVNPKDSYESDIVVSQWNLRPFAVTESYLEGKQNQNVLLYEGPQTNDQNVDIINFSKRNDSPTLFENILWGYWESISISDLNSTSDRFYLVKGEKTGKVDAGLAALALTGDDFILPVVKDLSSKKKKPVYTKFARFGRVTLNDLNKYDSQKKCFDPSVKPKFYAKFLGFYEGRGSNNQNLKTAELNFEETFPQDFEIKASDIEGLSNVSIQNNKVSGKLSIKYKEENGDAKAENGSYRFSITLTPKKIGDYNLNNSAVKVDNQDIKDTMTFNPLSISVKDIQVNVTDQVSINLGESKKINVEYVGSQDIVEETVWQSSDPTIASVDNQGNVTASGTKPGNVTITLTVKHAFGEITKEIQVHVIKLAESINANPDNIKLRVGQEYPLDKINVIVGPNDATYKDYEWDDTSDSYIYFSEDHKSIVGTNPGETKLIVRPKHPKDGNVFKEITVLVYAPLDSIYFNPITMTKGEIIDVDGLIQKNPTMTLEQIIIKSYSVDNEYLAAIDSSGELTAKRLGKVHVTVTGESESGKKLEAILEVDIVEKKSTEPHKNDGDLY
ncbi:Ig-like domain-containing protein [Bacillus massilinigeriensis]|uniref:Ig-like domain-containing protein n=1 Tax=Bacillus massilionigeriensis TaxID=1805475 RepID=UPI00096AE8FC|nr:Ig-like domain-containing protein [Bacillus massilionigeriensis]